MKVLGPFKHPILSLNKKEATLRHADIIFTLLLRELREEKSTLADMLYERLRREIVTRRTALSSVVAVLHNTNYDFELEWQLGVAELSEDGMISIRVEISEAS